MQLTAVSLQYLFIILTTYYVGKCEKGSYTNQGVNTAPYLLLAIIHQQQPLRIYLPTCLVGRVYTDVIGSE